MINGYSFCSEDLIYKHNRVSGFYFQIHRNVSEVTSLKNVSEILICP